MGAVSKDPLPNGQWRPGWRRSASCRPIAHPASAGRARDAPAPAAPRPARAASPHGQSAAASRRRGANADATALHSGGHTRAARPGLTTWPGLATEQLCAQQPGRLQRHAHAFADDRVSLACGIADAEHCIIRSQADARVQWTGGQPGALAGGALQRCADPVTLRVSRASITSPARRPGDSRAAGFETVAADAASHGGHAVVGHRPCRHSRH